MTLVWRNRRLIARRTGWPAGALAECERLDAALPDWSVWWLPETRWPDWLRPAGFAAFREGGPGLVGGDELRRGREDHVRRRPRVWGPDVAQLLARIAAAEKRVAAVIADDERLVASIRRGIR